MPLDFLFVQGVEVGELGAAQDVADVGQEWEDTFEIIGERKFEAVRVAAIDDGCESVQGPEPDDAVGFRPRDAGGVDQGVEIGITVIVEELPEAGGVELVELLRSSVGLGSSLQE